MVRKPGGKYKGVVTRQKGAETKASEADEKAQATFQDSIRRMEQEKREKEILAKRGLLTKQEEEEERKRQKLIMYLQGTGPKKLPRKYFDLWKIGHTFLMREKEQRKRDQQWRMYCSVPHDNYFHRDSRPPHCEVHGQLRDVVFEMPFESTRRLVHSMASRGPSVIDEAFNMASRKQTRTATMSSTMPRTMSSPNIVGGSGTGSTLLPQIAGSRRDESDPDDWEVATHHGTGRRVLYDRGRARMVFADFMEAGGYSPRNVQSHAKHVRGLQEAMNEGVSVQGFELPLHLQGNTYDV